jgi:hypothetical protein
MGAVTVQLQPAPSGFDSLAFGTPTAVLNQRFLLASGFTQLALGTPSLLNLNQQITPPGFSSSLAGTPGVQLQNRALQPAGLDSFITGATDVRNGARVISGATAGTGDYGRPTVWFRVRDVLAAGSLFTSFGGHDASHRNRSISVYGWHSMKLGLHAVTDPDPPTPPPAERTLRPSGFDVSAFGLPVLLPPRLRPAGFDAGFFGEPTLRDNAIRPESFMLDDASRFGMANVSGSQFLAPPGLESEAQVGVPFISPYTLRISENQYGDELNPIYRFPSTSTPSAFATVTLSLRTIFAHGYDPTAPTEPTQVPSPRVVHFIQNIAAHGWDSMTDQTTIVVIGGNLTIAPYWGRDTEFETIEGNYDTAAYGTPVVTGFRPIIEPPSIPPNGWGAPRVELFNRTIEPAGHYSARMPEQTWVSHSPRTVAAVGSSMAIVGAQTVWFRVRELKPAGIAPPPFYAAAEGFVYTRSTIQAAGFDATQYGLPTAFLTQNGAYAGLGDTSVFGRARVGACAC